MNQELIDRIPKESPLVSDQLKAQLKGVLDKLNQPLKLVTIMDMDQEGCLEMGAFLNAVVPLSPFLSLEFKLKGEDAQLEEKLNASMLPVVGLFKGDEYIGAAFHGTPGGQEINSFALALYNAAGPGQPLDPKTEKKIRSLKKKNNIKIYVSLSCHYCPAVVTAGQRIALMNPNVVAEMVDARLYPELMEEYKLSRVPAILLNDKAVYLGAKDIDEILKLLR